MGIYEALLLGILQGFTEFLPISSSGHLVLMESFLQLPVKDLMGFDVAVHFGTLLAIFVYFRNDFRDLIMAFFKLFRRKDSNNSDQKTLEDQKMIWILIVCTLPAVLVGLLAADYLEDMFRTTKSVAVMMLIVAFYFLLAEQIGKRMNNRKITMKTGLIIGVAQALALIPGVSRSGSTIATGIFQGIDRQSAARFSFLLGSIAISAATVLSLYKVIKGDIYLPGWDLIMTGILSSFLSGYVAVSMLMRFLKRHSLSVFALYLIVLSAAILVFI